MVSKSAIFNILRQKDYFYLEFNENVVFLHANKNQDMIYGNWFGFYFYYFTTAKSEAERRVK